MKKMKGEIDRKDAFYKACHQMAVNVIIGEDRPMDQIVDKLLGLAQKIRLPFSDAEIRKEFLRVFLGILWQRLESAYCAFSDNAVFEERLEVWVETFLNIRRPATLYELISRHMRENPRPPLLCDIYQRLSCEDLGIARPASNDCGEGASPGYAQKLFDEWMEKRNQERKNGTA